MYDFLEGIVASKGALRVVLDLQGQGFALEVDARSLGRLPPVGQRARLYTILRPGEDQIRLFGFATEDDRSLFSALIAIAGIGPSHALSLLSTFEPAELLRLAQSNDAKTIAKTRGVGPKLAQRLCTELATSRLAVGAPSLASHTATPPPPATPSDAAAADALAALIVLGYSEDQALRAITKARKAHGDEASTDVLIREALRA